MLVTCITIELLYILPSLASANMSGDLLDRLLEVRFGMVHLGRMH